jgi:hypothetical protein
MRRQHSDVASLVRLTRDFNERQSQLFFHIVTFLVRYQAPELQPLIDEDVTQAMAALAATFETSSRGIIYEHRAASVPAERLVNGLKPLLTEAGQGGGTVFERDASVVLRRLENAGGEVMEEDAGHRRAFLDLIGRIIHQHENDSSATEHPDEAPRVIIP